MSLKIHMRLIFDNTNGNQLLPWMPSDDYVRLKRKGTYVLATVIPSVDISRSQITCLCRLG